MAPTGRGVFEGHKDTNDKLACGNEINPHKSPYSKENFSLDLSANCIREIWFISDWLGKRRVQKPHCVSKHILDTLESTPQQQLFLKTFYFKNKYTLADNWAKTMKFLECKLCRLNTDGINCSLKTSCSYN